MFTSPTGGTGGTVRVLLWLLDFALGLLARVSGLSRYGATDELPRRLAPGGFRSSARRHVIAGIDAGLFDWATAFRRAESS
jgi:hypothetical protein